MEKLIYLHLLATDIKPGELPRPNASSGTLTNIFSIVFTIIGAFALLILVVSGLRYIVSAGDPQKASTAKNGIVYALIGLVVAIMAQAIVVFVVKGL